MVSAESLSGNVLLGRKLQIDVKNSNLNIVESALYMKSTSMPLTKTNQFSKFSNQFASRYNVYFSRNTDVYKWLQMRIKIRWAPIMLLSWKRKEALGRKNLLNLCLTISNLLSTQFTKWQAQFWTGNKSDNSLVHLAWFKYFQINHLVISAIKSLG